MPVDVVPEPALEVGTVRVFKQPQPLLESPVASQTTQSISLDGLTLALGAAAKNEQGPSPDVRAHSLSAQDAGRVLAGLPGAVQADDTVEYAWKAGPKPPDMVQARRVEHWTPGPGQAVKPSGPLRIQRYSPEGKISQVDTINIRFSQPMFALGASLQRAVQAHVHITPKVQGDWQWVDPSGLRFMAKPGLARATQYTVRVSTGLTAHSGAALQRDFEFKFSTAPAKLRSYAPTGGPTARQPIIRLRFDIPVVPKQVLSKVVLTPKGGGREISLRVAGAQDYAGDPEVQRSATDDSTVDLVATRPLRKGGRYAVQVQPGVAPASGDVASESRTKFEFRVHERLTLTEVTCGRKCRPHDTIQWVFSNRLAPIEDLKERVTIRPKLKDMDVSVSGGRVYLRGKKEPRTRYTVSLKGGVKDVYGGRLKGPFSKRFVTSNVDYYGRPLIADPFVVVPKSARPLYSFLTHGIEKLKVKVYRVKPSEHRDYAAFTRAFFDTHEGYARYASEFQGLEKRTAPPGRWAFERTYKGTKDSFTMHAVDLGSALTKGLGHVVLVIEADEPLPNQKHKQGTVVWFQRTNVGLTAMSGPKMTYALTTDLSTGAPLPGVIVSPLEDTVSAMSDAEGVAQLPGLMKPRAHVLLAQRGSDVALMPWSGARRWQAKQKDSLTWFVADDRKLYRPGEAVHIKGWVRAYSVENGGLVSSAQLNGRKISWTAKDARGEEIATGQTEVLGQGGFDLSFVTAQSVNLGRARVQFEFSESIPQSGRSHSHGFRVEEFRRPEFEVNVQAGPGPYFVGGDAVFDARAKYYSGGALSAAPVRWRLESRPAYFTPPNRDRYYFGQQSPWWRHHHGRGRWNEPSFQTHEYTGRTNGDGGSTARAGLSAITRLGPMNLLAQASVSDLNNQTWAASTQVLVHPARVMVGTHLPSRYYQAGEHLTVETLVTDVEGRAVAGRPVAVTVRAYDRGDSDSMAACEYLSKPNAHTCDAKVLPSGLYEVVATVTDKQKRQHRSRRYVWVAGAAFPGRALTAGSIELSTGKDKYHEGEILKVMVRTPFAPAEVMVTYQREGLLESQVLHMETTSHVISVPLSARHSPGFRFDVRAVGQDKIAAGSRYIPVYPDSKVVELEVSPQELVARPGQVVQVTAQAKDAQGVVAGAEVVFIVVDESVLAMADYRIPHPIEAFYGYRGGGAQFDELRKYLRLPPTPEEMAMMQESAAPSQLARMKKSAAGAPAAEAPSGGLQVRKNFSALALFAPRAVTDAEGRATVSMTLPDSLTRYRITALLAADAARFGYAEASITARLPLMVRPSAPRFANHRDRFDLPVSVQNLTDEMVTADVALKAHNLLVTETSGWRVKVPAQGRVQVQFAVTTVAAGPVSAYAVVRSEGSSDAAEIRFPVWSPINKHTEAVYGYLDEGAAQYPLAVPKDVIPGFGGVRIDTSTTLLETLKDAYLYLYNYPYSCTEQIASRLLGTAALGELLTRLQVPGATDAEAQRAHLQRDIATASSRQRSDGGFGLWARARGPAHVFASVHVLHALARAQKSGLKVEQTVISRGSRFLQSIEKHIPKYYSDPSRHLIQAYALYVQARLGANVDRPAEVLARKMQWPQEDLSTFGWLLGSLSKNAAPLRSRLLRHIANHTDETASSAHVAKVWSSDGHWHMNSERRADAVILAALIRADPESDVISKLMRGLMDKRTQGRWSNTQENAFVLVAGLDYFRAYESQAPDLSAKVWFGQFFAGQVRHEGHSTKTAAIEVPTPALRGQELPVTISKEGAGRLYYRLGLTYAKADPVQPAVDRGFKIERTYEGLNPNDVRKDAQGDWHIRAGALVRVRLSLKVPGQRYYVALVDPLPAGLEPQNPELATTGRAPEAQTDSGVQRYWADHQNLRDERVEAFATSLRGGTYEYSYLARATTAGSFLAAGALAEEMYHPETYGRSATARVFVEAAP